MEYYPATEKNKVLLGATTWMNPENTMLSERSQTQKGFLVYDSIYMKWPLQANLQRQKAD